MQSEAGKLLYSKTALKRCTSTQHLLKRKLVSLTSPEHWQIFLPRSERSWRADVLYTPKVSIAMATNKHQPSMLEYLSSLREAASSAAEPASRAAPATYESANGQVTVTSHHSALPLCQGTSVRPSGRFPSVRNSSVGSLVTGKPAEAKPRAIIIIIIPTCIGERWDER